MYYIYIYIYIYTYIYCTHTYINTNKHMLILISLQAKVHGAAQKVLHATAHCATAHRGHEEEGAAGGAQRKERGVLHARRETYERVA